MTQKQAKLTLRALGFTMAVRDGEFRVSPMDGTPDQKEARAYYTDDMADAIATARQEVARTMRDAACEAHRAARAAERALEDSFVETAYGALPAAVWTAYLAKTQSNVSDVCTVTDIVIPDTGWTGWNVVETSI